MFKPGSVFDIFLSRINQLESDIENIDVRNGDIDSLLDRCGIIEGDLINHGSRIESLEVWKDDKYSSINDETNMSVSTTIGTAVITLGLSAPLASSIESNINAVKTEINSVKFKVNSILSALRSRGIINA